MSEKKFSPEGGGGDSNKELKPLPPRVREALEKFKKKQNEEAGETEAGHKAGEPNIDADMAQMHQNFRSIEENFFKTVLEEIMKRGASESDIEKLKNGYKEYAECWDKAFVEKGEKLSIIKDVYPRLSPSNRWLEHSKRITEKYFGIERN